MSCGKPKFTLHFLCSLPWTRSPRFMSRVVVQPDSDEADQLLVGGCLATCARRPGVRAVQGPVWCWSQGLEGPGVWISAQGTMLLLVWALRPFLRRENGFGAKVSKKWNQPFQSKRVYVLKLKPVEHNDSRLSGSLWELFFPKISHVPRPEHASHSSS